MEPQHTPGALDALLPDAVARAAESLGVKKAAAPLSTLVVLAVLAGAFIGLGAMFATLVATGAGDLPYGVGRLLAGLAFSLGLVLVVVGGAQLFTGDMLMVMAWAGGKIRLSRMLVVWVVVWLGNFVGAAATAFLVFLSGQYAFAQGGVGATALHYAMLKLSYPPGQALVLGILCNVLVCLAVWLSLAARSVTDKVVAIVFPVTAFVAAGFEHSVANMYFVPLGMLLARFAPDWFWLAIAEPPPVLLPSDFAVNLAAVSLGNWIGGAVLVGLVYWFIYLRGKDRRIG